MDSNTELTTSDFHFGATELRVLDLLGKGVLPSQVAAAVGVSPGRISQLISTDEFSSRLSELRYNNLAKHNDRDAVYDEMEDTLQKQLKASLCMVMDPMKQISILTRLNQMRRRGVASVDPLLQKNTVVKLQLPAQIIQNFTVNAANQVTTVTEGSEAKSMVTIQSGQIKKLAQIAHDIEYQEKAVELIKQQENKHEQQTLSKFGL